jgi:quercetin dioxygenase-like cupin family protein
MAHSFFVAGDRAALIANDLDDARYQGALHYLPVGAQVPTRANDEAETVFYVEAGIVEFMVGGPTAILNEGHFARIAPGTPYAYRNAGGETARLLVRTQRPVRPKRLVRATLEFAA